MRHSPHPGLPAWPGTRALVTGATGFIGAHLVDRLTSLGAKVHAVSRRPVESTAGGPTWHVADLADAESTRTLVDSVRPDVAFHLASAVTGARDVRLVHATMAGNLASAVNLLTAVTDVTPDTSVVLAGSVEEPGPGLAPSSPYAVAKWAATGYARMFHALWGVRVCVLRVAMVYGPGQPDTTKLVPYVTLALLREQEPELGSGTRLVDWVYVDDVVDAFLAAARSERAAGRVLDIGSGCQVSIRDTVELLSTVVGGNARPRFGAIADRPLDNAQTADPAPAGEVLGWHPQVELAEGLRRTTAWYARQV
jgi:nucleoside-diphosphate-sugar epimerase